MQDLPNALNDAAVAEGLGLANLKTRDWAIFKTSAIKGEGLFEGLDWLSNMLKTRRRWVLLVLIWQGVYKMCHHSWIVSCETAICHDKKCFGLFVGSTDVYACWVWGSTTVINTFRGVIAILVCEVMYVFILEQRWSFNRDARER